jgi:hypothetical protein
VRPVGSSDVRTGLRLARWACALLFPLSLGGCAGDRELTNEQIAQNFTRIAFGAEYGANDRLSKWIEKDIRVHLVSGAVGGADLERVNRRIASHLDQLARLTRLHFTFPGSVRPEYSHIIVFLLPEADLRRELRETFGIDPERVTCFGTAFRSGGRIRGALVGVPDHLEPAEIDACLVEELTQSLGLFNDDRHVRPSIFNDDDSFHELTWQDEILLRVLYDPRLQPGMDREQAEPLVRTILEEIRPPGRPRTP